MKALIHLYMLLLLALLMAGCKKETAPEPPVISTPQPPYPLVTKSTVTAYGNVTVTSYRYDTATWFLKSRRDQYGLDIYDYSQPAYFSYGSKSLSLNTQGLVEREGSFSNPMQYWYNADSTLREHYMYMSTRGVYTYYPDGNLESVTYTLPDHFSPPQGPDVITYFYKKGISNTIGNRNYGKPYFGKSSPLLPDSTFEYMVYAGDTAFFSTTYQYQLSPKGLVLQETHNRHQLDSALHYMDTSVWQAVYEYY